MTEKKYTKKDNGPISPKFYEPAEVPSAPPFVGRVYGEITFWIAILGLIIGIIGVIISFSGNSIMDSHRMINELWKGKHIKQIWEDAGGMKAPDNGYWFVKYLPKGDAVAELGITLMGLAAVAGMAGVSVVLLKDQDYIFLIFSLVVLIIMLCTMTGVLRTH